MDKKPEENESEQNAKQMLCFHALLTQNGTVCIIEEQLSFMYDLSLAHSCSSALGWEVFWSHLQDGDGRKENRQKKHICFLFNVFYKME